MCGIAALFGIKQNPQVFDSIVPMCNVIRHRGPDDEGFAFFSSSTSKTHIYGGKDSPETLYRSRTPYTPSKPYCHLPNDPLIGVMGHRRLSIVDISSAGHQPMCSEDMRFWITYNGEVYNFIEIREELISQGHTFKTSSDTEVIIKAYQQWGERCLDRFNGMFAFIIYDTKKHSLFAARDRFGVKPLYYWISPSGLAAFASEIKQFTVLPEWQAKINGQRCYDYLVWGTQDHTEETLFSGVLQLRGGEKLTWNLLQEAQPRICSWYTLSPKPFHGSFEEAGLQFRDLLSDAVRLRLRADVDVGSCLSGGLDSSSIVCLVNEQLSKQGLTHQQKTFSACSHVKRVDERHHIETVVNQCKVKDRYCYPSLEGLFEQRENLIWHQDEPFGSTSIFAQWEVFKLAHEDKVKVMLDGQGADEQLAGYHSFFSNRFFELMKQFRWISLGKELIQSHRLHGKTAIKHALKPLLPAPLLDLLLKTAGFPSQKPEWLEFSLLETKDEQPFPNKHRLPVNQNCLLQINHSNLPMLLHWEDRNSMAHSVESRTPFLDYRLVEFITGLQSDYKLSNGITKQVMREGMKKILPESIRTRIDKIGFATSEEEWIRKEQPQVFKQAIQTAMDVSQGLFKSNLPAIADDIISGKRPFNFFIWRLINFGDWIQKFNVNIRKF